MGKKIFHKTLKEIIIWLCDLSNKDQEFLEDYKNFYNEIEKIDNEFYKETKQKYRLIPKPKEKGPNEKGVKFYIDYVEDYCPLTKEERKLEYILNYFKGKEINLEEIKKFEKENPKV